MSDDSNLAINKVATQQGTMRPIKSPCIGVCALNIENVCEGCYRTADEITAWVRLTHEQQVEVVALSWQRACASGKVL